MINVWHLLTVNVMLWFQTMCMLYREDQHSNSSAPKPVEYDSFRRYFHNAPELIDVEISDMKRSFGRCTICRYAAALRLCTCCLVFI